MHIRILSVVLLLIMKVGMGQSDSTALLLIDIQDFYFPGGQIELYSPDIAAENASLLLEKFREKKRMVVHVRHNFEPGGEIHQSVSPLAEEKVITKDHVNVFIGTDLTVFLADNGIRDLVICGMQTHMCVEAATRFAADYGFNCTLIKDACATRDIVYESDTISHADVQHSTLATLSSYSSILSTKEYLLQLKKDGD